MKIIISSLTSVIALVGLYFYIQLAPHPQTGASNTAVQSITTSTALPIDELSYRSERVMLGPTLTPIVVPALIMPQPTVQFDPPAPPTTTPEPYLTGYAPEMAGKIITTTTRFDVYRGRNSFDADTIFTILPRINAGVAHAERLLGSRLQQRTSLGFYAYGSSEIRGIRGLAATDERRLRVYYSAGEYSENAIRVAIHEIAHQLEYDRYGAENQQLADTILHEGLATWLTDDEWLKRTDEQSWREHGRYLLNTGQLLPIRRDPSGAAADLAYEGWASFVDYLIRTYGWQAFDDLYCSGQGRYPGSAQYELVYQKTLNELVTEWRNWLVAV